MIVNWRGTNWIRQARLVKERDNFTCQHCGFIGFYIDLRAHHIIPYQCFDNYLEANSLDNLTTLCKKCHTKADNKYWAEHPEMFDSKRFPLTSMSMSRICRDCGQEFIPPFAHSLICDNCRTHTCEVCSKVFISSKVSRKIRFCSRECNKQYRIANRKWPHKCQTCGKPIQAGRSICKECWLKLPSTSLLRYPKRKPGRRPKGQSEVAIIAAP